MSNFLKFKDGDFVTGYGKNMIVRKGYHSGGKGMVYCEWADPEDGELCHDWFDARDLQHFKL